MSFLLCLDFYLLLYHFFVILHLVSCIVNIFPFIWFLDMVIFWLLFLILLISCFSYVTPNIICLISKNLDIRSVITDLFSIFLFDIVYIHIYLISVLIYVLSGIYSPSSDFLFNVGFHLLCLMHLLYFVCLISFRYHLNSYIAFARCFDTESVRCPLE